MSLTISAIDRMIHSRLRFLNSVKRSFRPAPVICGTNRRFRLSGLVISVLALSRLRK
jgi:hypothetical protein